MQFPSARRETQPVAAIVSPGGCAIGCDIVVFGDQAVNLIFKVRHSNKGLLEKSNKSSLALCGNIVILDIVLPHDLVQLAQIVMNKNSID